MKRHCSIIWCWNLALAPGFGKLTPCRVFLTSRVVQRQPRGMGSAIFNLAGLLNGGKNHFLLANAAEASEFSGMKIRAAAIVGASSALSAFALAAFPAPAAEMAGDAIPAQNGNIIVHPINHATLALQWNGVTIYVDPVGEKERFKGLPSPDLILLTDIHGDHLSKQTLEALAKTETKLVAPSAVGDQLPADLLERTTILNNGKKTELRGISIEAIPAYNTTPERLKFHAKGRGNGYVVTLGGKRVYISGDTEDTPEMRALRNIDVAFLCMNLPYTMTVQQAAEAVRAFKPKIVYPYHSRGSDLEKFKALVGANAGVEVRLKDWYATKQE